MSHQWTVTLAWADVLRAYPDGRVCLAHMNRDAPEVVWPLLQELPNLYTDTSWQPADAIRRAKGYLARLDKFSAAGSTQADLFAPPGVATQAEEPPLTLPEAAAVATKLGELDPDAMTPRDAHAALYELRKLLGR